MQDCFDETAVIHPAAFAPRAATTLQGVSARRRNRLAFGAIAALAVGWALVIHAMGWGQLASYAQVRALADGRAEIDAWHWETKDKAWVDGHFYSVKAPGLAIATLPAYLALDGVGAQSVAEDAAMNVRRTAEQRWRPFAEAPFAEHGYSEARATRVNTSVEFGTPMVWALTLLGALVPAVVMLLLVRALGDRIEPGFGIAAAVTLGLATMVMTFASEYFPHVVAASLGFAAFALLLARAPRPAAPRPDRARRPARRARGHLRVPARARRGDPLRLRARARGAAACARAVATPREPCSAPRPCSPSTSGRSARRFSSPTGMRSRSRAPTATPSSASTTRGSSGSRSPSRALRSTCFFRPRAADADAGTRARSRGRRRDAAPRLSRRVERDPRGRRRVFHLQRRLLAAVRRRNARARAS